MLEMILPTPDASFPWQQLNSLKTLGSLNSAPPYLFREDSCSSKGHLNSYGGHLNHGGFVCIRFWVQIGEPS